MSAGRVVAGWRSTYGAATREQAERLAVEGCAPWLRARPGREARVREGEPARGEAEFIVEIREVPHA